MFPQRPDPDDVMKAIDIYLKYAYGNDIPVLVKSQLASLRSWKGDFFEAALFAQDLHSPPTRYSARLGNRYYPHMKLVFELSPDDRKFLFRVDAHDRHVCPPERTPEYQAFSELMRENQQLVEQIEAAWAEAGLPTFRTYLREDLLRRTGAQQGEVL